jgi:hypothetical protein
MSSNNCVFCGKTSYQEALYRDWPFDCLGVKGMYCWECYHKEIVKHDKAAFSLSIVGENSGCIADYTLSDAISAALEDTEGNMDMGMAIDSHIGGSYTASLIVRNGGLYVRFADLYPVMEAKSEDEKRLLLEQIIRQLTWTVQRPIPSNKE